MTIALFDYLFIKLAIAKINQPVSLFTAHGEKMKGKYINAFIDRTDSLLIHRILQIETKETEIVNVTEDNIITLKISFLNEFIGGSCDYSLYCVLEYLELEQRVEIVLNNGDIIQGFIISHPTTPGLYGMEIGILTINGEFQDFDLVEIEVLSLIFNSFPYMNRIIAYNKMKD